MEEYKLEEPFNSALEQRHAIDFRLVKGNGKTDHEAAKALGYEIKLADDGVTYYNEGIKGFSFTSYGDWGTIYSFANNVARNLFIKLCEEGIVEPWRIRAYIDEGNETVSIYDYDHDRKEWKVWDDNAKKSVIADCPFNKEPVEDKYAEIHKVLKEMKKYEKKIFDFDHDENRFHSTNNGKFTPKEDGMYLTIRCGLSGIYTVLNEWKDGHWQMEIADGSTTIAFSDKKIELESLKNNKE